MRKLTNNGNVEQFSFSEDGVQSNFSDFRSHCRLSQLRNCELCIFNTITCLRKKTSRILETETNRN